MENGLMTIKVGDKLPQATFRVMTADGPAAKTTDELFKGKKVVLFAVPGAFTPTCHRNHLPGYVGKAAEIKEKGVDAIMVTSTNDVFVMDAWAKASGAAGTIEFLADGNADFAKEIGLSMDGSGFGLGTRSQRYAAIIDDGVITELMVESTPGLDVSSADSVLSKL
jgi:peroxiredoxin